LNHPGSHCCSISVVILTYNEEANLPTCLNSLATWGPEVFVVDSGSTDRTQEIARQAGARVFENPFETHSQQWVWALKHLPIQTSWVLGLDADQSMTPELAKEIAGLTAEKLEFIEGAYIKRRQLFRRKWIRHGGYYPKYLLKLFRRDKVVIDTSDLVDHHFYVRGPVIKLEHDLIEANYKEDDISFWTEKHSRYASLMAVEEYRWNTRARQAAIRPALFGSPDQRILALKMAWRGMPLYVRPFLYFAYRYFLRLGFLDGKQGAIFHFLQAFWFRLLVDIKLDDMQSGGTHS
jgi:glycosyltransferase involved in cell wall biosynthesis